jgi:outer membrane immunogenic protein
MKKLYAVIIALNALGIGGPAIAADMALKAAPPAAAPYSWTGWYVGLNAGGSFGKANDSSTYGAAAVPFSSTSSRLDGFVGGGQVGYNWQTGSTVFGLEADIQGTSEKSSAYSALIVPSLGCTFAPCLGPATLTDSEKLPWFGTVRGRIGVTPSPTWLLYVTGGLAYGEIKSSEALAVGPPPAVPGAAVASFSNDRAGWTLGGGAEASIGGNWTAKVEYLYLDFGHINNTYTGAVLVTPVMLTTHVTDNIVRVGVNYHFH